MPKRYTIGKTARKRLTKESNYVASCYVVHVNNPPALYKPGYFPRSFKLKRDAIDCVLNAINCGASMGRVECPDGAELDFRKQ